MSANAPFLSIIVPVLNEARLIGDFLRTTRTVVPDAEIIVIDGGSSDQTVIISEPLAHKLTTAPRGRASQMNAGAAIARGDVLWFLHADLAIPSNSLEQIRTALSHPGVTGGCFRLRFPRREWIYRISDSVGNVGVNVFGFALGDHGIFCRREEFNRVGGYRELPILEDADLYRRLRHRGAMRQLRAKIVSDPRAFEQHGRYRTTCIYFAILALYVLGAPIRFLNRIYRRFCRIESPSGRAAVLAPATR
jgi:rSAM/selenodomain-associated transferase 2